MDVCLDETVVASRRMLYNGWLMGACDASGPWMNNDNDGEDDPWFFH